MPALRRILDKLFVVGDAGNAPGVDYGIFAFGIKRRSPEGGDDTFGVRQGLDYPKVPAVSA
jgi:hypothetical protein